MTRLATILLKFYKGLISPLLPASCRFVPSCSEYAAEALARHGFFRGSALAAWRVVRCNPLAHGGYDPVSRISKTKLSKTRFSKIKLSKT